MPSILSIIGAGGHGRVIADAATESGKWQFIEFFDDDFTSLKPTGLWSLAGPLKFLIDQEDRGNRQVVIGIGHNAQRYFLQKQFLDAGWTIATVIHPSATVSSSCTLEPGVVIMAGAVINTGAQIGAGCIVNTKSSIDHDCQIGPFVHISPGATISGTVTIGERSWIGAGSVVINNTRIGKDTIVGAGSTVIRDIPDNVVAVGSPTRIINTRAPATDFLPRDNLLGSSG